MHAFTKVVVASIVAGSVTLGGAGVASAATHGHGGESKAAKGHQPKRPAPKQTVHAEGLIVGHTSSAATVFVKTGQAGGRHLRHQTITVALPSTMPATSLQDGDKVNLQGFAGSGGYQATKMTVAPLPAMTILGTLTSSSGSLLQVATKQFTDGDQDESEGDATTVDASSATVTLDGATTTVDQIPAGATLAVLGERDGDTVLAAQVIAYSTAPGEAAGTVTTVSGNQLQLSATEQDDENGGATSPATVNVDVTNATISLNGGAGSVTDLAAGDRVLALGVSNPDGSLTANLVFAFNANDDNPAGDNDSGDNDSGDGNGSGSGD